MEAGREYYIEGHGAHFDPNQPGASRSPTCHVLFFGKMRDGCLRV